MKSGKDLSVQKKPTRHKTNQGRRHQRKKYQQMENLTIRKQEK